MGLSPTQTQSASRQLQPAGLQSLLAEKWRAGCAAGGRFFWSPLRGQNNALFAAMRLQGDSSGGLGSQFLQPAVTSSWPSGSAVRALFPLCTAVLCRHGRPARRSPPLERNRAFNWSLRMAAGGQSRGAPSRQGLGHGAALRLTASMARIMVLGQGGGRGPWRRQARPQPSAYAALHTKEDSWKQHLAVVQGCTAPPAHGWMRQQALESVSRADTQSASCRRMMAPRWRLRGRGQGAGDEKAKCVAPGRLGAKAHRI